MSARKSRKASSAESPERGGIDVQEAKWDQALHVSASIMESIDEAEKKGLQPSESEIASVARRVKEARRALRGLEEALSGVLITPTTRSAAVAAQFSRQAGLQPQQGAMRKPTRARPTDAASYGPRFGAHMRADDRGDILTGLQADSRKVAASRAPMARPPAGYAAPSFWPGGSSPMPGSAARMGQSDPLHTAIPGTCHHSSKSLQQDASFAGKRPAGGAMKPALAPAQLLRPRAQAAGGPAPGTTLQSIPAAPPPPTTADVRSSQMTGKSVGAGAPAGVLSHDHGAMGWGMGQSRGMYAAHLQGGGGGQQQQQQHLTWGWQSSSITPPAAFAAGSSGQGRGKGGGVDPWTAHGSADSVQEDYLRDSWTLPGAAPKQGEHDAADAGGQGESMYVASSSGKSSDSFMG